MAHIRHTKLLALHSISPEESELRCSVDCLTLCTHRNPQEAAVTLHRHQQISELLKTHRSLFAGATHSVTAVSASWLVRLSLLFESYFVEWPTAQHTAAARYSLNSTIQCSEKILNSYFFVVLVLYFIELDFISDFEVSISNQFGSSDNHKSNS